MQQFIDPILITYGQTHPLNNACQEWLKLIGLTIVCHFYLLFGSNFSNFQNVFLFVKLPYS
jgi:hypothetical protein